MATYNRAHFIVETLHSIQKQTYTNWECLIIDDGGTDDTKEVISSILEKDTRFNYVLRSNTYQKGLPGCRNFGLDIAKGDYIIFFDDDDIVHPQNLEINVELLLKNPKVSFCHFQKKPFKGLFNYDQLNSITNYNAALTPINFVEQTVTQEIGVASCTVLWRKKCFEQIRFQESLMYAEEWECYQRIFSEFSNGLLLNEVLYFNRKHENSNTGEFYSNNNLRVNSKKEAIKLVVKNLKQKNLLTPKCFNYLIGLAIAFRDIKLFEEIVRISEIPFKKRVFLTFKFYRYPFWRLYKKIEK